MNASLVIEQYPYWYILLCAALGAVYAFALYYKDNSFKEATTAQKRMLVPLSVLRWLTVSVIAFLLLTPLLKSRNIEVVNPYILLLQDNSESVGMAFKQPADTVAYAAKMRQLAANLTNQYKVASYHFGSDLQDGLKFSFTDKVTDISNSLDKLYNNYANQNVGAIILATDGIYNQGSNPLYSNSRFNVPVFSVALGDTTPRRDVVIDKVLHNKIAYLGDKFTIRIDVSAKNCNNETTAISISKGKDNGTKVFGKAVKINSANFTGSEEVTLDADSPGIQHYVIQVAPLSGEATTQNNRQDVYIEVLDNRQKILLLANSPHPDVSALKQAIETNKNYQVTTAYINNFNGAVRDYDLAILHGLPSAVNNASTVLGQLKSANIPLWFIVTAQTALSSLNQAQNIVQINGGGGNPNEAKADFQRNFSLFTFENELVQNLLTLPPLQAPFGQYKAAPTAQVLLKQKIGTVNTDYPLLVLEQASGYKMAVLCGEGLWRWRLYNFKQQQSHDAFNVMMSKIVQYLSVKNDKRKFRVNMPKTLYNENEAISFDAELYNDSYELINDPEVNILITSEDGKSYPFTFNKTGKAYTLNTGILPVGNYTYLAKTTFSGQEYKAQGSFSVVPLQLETVQTVANHRILYAMAQRYGGAVVPPSQIDSLLSYIQQQPNIKPVQYSSFKTQPLINLKWLFLFLLLFLAIEWFVRKFIGGY
ncbi:hypothetical protein C7N43_26575 [Sphingobacteriales bacterium UPWRP_1]|nr:hypothetical protein B6N25_04110 [Sphingobacteriales bacterium TSM_CSS]PSJ73927.1 hypothetical protein C7N43_26575 [Sphingobacteriales bacterium UPWRP_1]